jgi:hypothetical protein
MVVIMTSGIVIAAGVAMAAWSAVPPATAGAELARLDPVGSIETIDPTAPVQEPHILRPPRSTGCCRP